RFENKNPLNWPIPITEYPIDFNLYGFSNVKGVLCFEDKVGFDGIRSLEEVGKIVFWNPTTGEFKITPPSPFVSEPPGCYPQLRLHGFGYDQSTGDYKVIRHISFSLLSETDEVGKDPCHPPLWETYSLKNNSWRKVDQDMPTQYHGSVGVQVYMDGACHWWGEGETPNEVHLVSFFLSNDVYEKTSIPTNMDGGTDTRVMFRHLDVLNGSIAWISNYAQANTFHISILGEIGVKESWTKLFIVEPSSFVEHPIGMGKNGSIFFRKKDDELVWFSLTTHEIEELGVKGGRSCKTIVYKESFLQIEM
ncbi:F-box protein, partial [Trifolium pratense]